MRLFSRLFDPCFCAFCKSPRRVYHKKHVDWTNVLGASFLSMTGAFAYYGEPDPRGIVVFGVIIITLEIFVYLRWRMGLVCTLCGFDPILYKRSPELASNKVKQFFKERRESPSFHLSRSPLLEIERKQKRRERRDAELNLIEAKMLAKRPKSLTPPKAL